MIRTGQTGMALDHTEGKMSCVRKFPEVFEVVGVGQEKSEILKNLITSHAIEILQ